MSDAPAGAAVVEAARGRVGHRGKVFPKYVVLQAETLENGDEVHMALKREPGVVGGARASGREVTIVSRDAEFLYYLVGTRTMKVPFGKIDQVKGFIEDQDAARLRADIDSVGEQERSLHKPEDKHGEDEEVEDLETEDAAEQSGATSKQSAGNVQDPVVLCWTPPHLVRS